MDQDKAPKRQVLWERGGIPFWKDGWPENLRPSKGQKTRSGASDSQDATNSLLPGPFTVTLTFSAEKTLRFVYTFTDTHPEYRGSLPLFIQPIIDQHPTLAIAALERALLRDYSFHNESVTKSADRHEFCVEMRPRKRRLTPMQASSQATPNSDPVRFV